MFACKVELWGISSVLIVRTKFRLVSIHIVSNIVLYSTMIYQESIVLINLHGTDGTGILTVLAMGAIKTQYTGTIVAIHKVVTCAVVEARWRLAFVYIWGQQILTWLTHWGQNKLACICRWNIQMHFLREDHYISIQILLKFVHDGPNDNKFALVQVMAWCFSAPSYYLNQRWARSLMH